MGKPKLGRALATFGTLLAVLGAALSFDEVFMNGAVPLAFLGTVLGVAAFMFGARRFGGLGCRLLDSSADILGSGEPGDAHGRGTDGPQPPRQ